MSEKTHGASRVSEEAAPMTDSELAQSISQMSKGYGVIYGVPKTYSVNDSEKPVANTYTQRIPLEDTEVVFNKGVIASILIGAVIGVIGLISITAWIVSDILELFS
tara:strand:- start:2419 stop:2736 length:318 start_codon:yes stop_codon:yes gene_type:complete